MVGEADKPEEESKAVSDNAAICHSFPRVLVPHVVVELVESALLPSVVEDDWGNGLNQGDHADRDVTANVILRWLN